MVIKDDLILLPKAGVLLKEIAPTIPVDNSWVYLNTNGIAFCGANNLQYQEIADDIKKTPILSSPLDWIARMLCAGGLTYGSLLIDENGKDKLMVKSNPIVNDFLRKNKIITDLIWLASKQGISFWKLFFEIVRNQEGDKIVGVKCHKTPHCRVSIQNKENGLIEKAFINANWQFWGGGRIGDYTIEMPIVQPGYDPVGQLRLRKDSQRYMYVVDFPGLDEIYYPSAPWHSIFESKWLKLVQDIPSFKEALLRNRMNLNYVITVHPEFWNLYYSDWSELNSTERGERKSTFYKSIEDSLNGAKNAGKQIFSSMFLDGASGKYENCIDIKAIQNQTHSGEYLEDSQEGNYTILYALGFDGTLIGAMPSRSMGAGSGSDKREAWNLALTISKPLQDKILEVLNFISEYNGWIDPATNEPYIFWFKNYYLQTLDQVTPTNRTATVPTN